MDEVFVYDGTWEGMLSAVFDAFSMRCCRATLIRDDDPRPMFGNGCHEVTVDDEKCRRVWHGLRTKDGAAGSVGAYCGFSVGRARNGYAGFQICHQDIQP